MNFHQIVVKTTKKSSLQNDSRVNSVARPTRFYVLLIYEYSQLVEFVTRYNGVPCDFTYY